MKKIYHISIFWSILFSLAVLSFVSCGEDFPTNMDLPNEVVLKSLKVLNAGVDGNTVVEGVVDENTKSVWFPRLDAETNVSAIKFEAELSDGAHLEKDTYAFTFEEGKDASSVIIKVLNEPRFREYKVTLRLRVPVFGADFSKKQVYDYSGNELGNPVYPTFTGALTRGSSFDGEYVLIVTRHATLSHLLKVSDLKNNVITPIALNLTGVAGGTFPVNVGAKVKNHTYIANLSGTTGMKIYHWTDPSIAPEVILNVDPASIPGAGKRHGDNLSYHLDANGNGYFFFGDNAVTEVLRIKIENFTNVTEIKVLPTQTRASFNMSMNRVEQTDDYIFSGYETGNVVPLRVVNSDGALLYAMTNVSSVPSQSADARVFHFNGERYLMMATAPRYSGNAVLYLYDITKGATTIDALKEFELGDKIPLLQYSIGGGVNTSPATQTGYHIVKDNEGKDSSLLLYTASNDAGFAIIEVPKKVLDE